MLKAEIKTAGNYKPSIEKIDFDGNIKETDTELSLGMTSIHTLDESTEINLYRRDGKRIYYTDKIMVSFDGNDMVLPKFSKRVLLRDFSVSVKKTTLNRIPTETGETETCTIIQFKNEHCLISNRDDIEIKGQIVNGLDSIGRGYQRCDSDVVLASLNQDKYDSVKDGYYLLYDGKNGHVTAETENYYCNGLDNITVNLTGSDGNDYVGIVPVDANGQDYENVLLVVSNADLGSLSYFLCDDERFIHYDDKGAAKALKNGVWGEYVKDRLSFSLPIGQNFSLKMNKAEEIDNYVDLVTERNLNGIVDYERYQFSPYFKKAIDGGLFPATEIEFNLHFRERDTENGWKVKSDGFWNAYYYNERRNSLSHKTAYNGEYLQDSDSDLIGEIGFDDEDVNYQSKSLQQSFLRLSFYDTPFRGNQNLLFYNTLFVNTSRLYAKYAKAAASKSLINGEYSQYQWESRDSLRLGVTFNAYNKFTASGSSEGFYLYLFKGALKEGETSTTIYMKAEFNHAKYGSTVPFILPRAKDGTPISPISKDFPINYYDAENKKIDMQAFGNDTYIPITIQYLEETDEYIWYSPIVQENGKMVFNLFEPRLNPTKASEINARDNGDSTVQKLQYNADKNYMVSETMSVRNTGERQICSKRFLKTVNMMSINGKVVKKSSKINFSASSTYEIVYELNTSEIASGAFVDLKDVARLKFNNNITKICDSVASNTSLNEVYFGTSITEIGKLAFSKNILLGKVDLSNCAKLETIGVSAFQGSKGLYEILLPSQSMKISNGAFSYTSITGITIPNGSSIGRFAFSRCYHLDDISKIGNNLELINESGYSMNGNKENAWGVFADCKHLIAKLNVESVKGKKNAYQELYKKFTNLADFDDMKSDYDEDIATGGSSKVNWFFKCRVH